MVISSVEKIWFVPENTFLKLLTTNLAVKEALKEVEF